MGINHFCYVFKNYYCCLVSLKLKFCFTSALSQAQLLRGQRVQAPNLIGFPGTWPLPGPPPPMAPSGIMQPDSVPLPETARLLPFLPMRPPDLSPVSSQPPGPPVSFPAAHSPGGPGAPCSSTIQTTSILTPHPGQSSFHGFLFSAIASLPPLSLPHPLPTTTLGISSSTNELGLLWLEHVNWEYNWSSEGGEVDSNQNHFDGLQTKHFQCS